MRFAMSASPAIPFCRLRAGRDGQVPRGSSMVAVVCLIRPDRLDALLDAAFAVVEPHIGVVSLTDADVFRAERF